MKTSFLLVLFTVSHLTYAQSDSDKDLQTLISSLKDDRFGRVKSIIDERLFSSGDESKK